MDVTVTIPEWVVTMPAWAWITAGVVLWYVVMAVLLRVFRRVIFHRQDNACDAALMWFVSPLFLVLFAVIGLPHLVGRFIVGGRRE